MSNKGRLEEFLQSITADLDRTVNFWLKHSHDKEFGGYFTCLGKDGTVYDELKYGWMQGRQVWMYAKLYNEVERFHTPEMLEAAQLGIKHGLNYGLKMNKCVFQDIEYGADFIMKHLCQKAEDTWRCFFSVNRDGSPVHMQRKIFTECFYTIAMSEMARATGKDNYKKEAIGMMNNIVHWVRKDNSSLNAPSWSGITPTNSLAVPMMLLAVLLELENMDASLTQKEYEGLTDWCVEQLKAHVQRDKYILEHVSLEGKELPGCQGRFMVPGHAIEGGWFLLELARRRNDESLKALAIDKFTLSPFEYGWDERYGGLLNFLDVDGHSPTQLEWNMKLWWPHCEALIALLMAYQDTHDEKLLDKFAQTFDYSYKHFVDPEYGEWYGYLTRQGEINMDFKGGPFKGCFHVPRCLMMCEKMLQELLSK